MKFWQLYLCIMLFLFVYVAGIPLISPAFADTTFISIFTTNCPACPTITELLEYDNSNKKISGNFTDNIRSKPQLDNHLNWYKINAKNQTIIFVEPTVNDQLSFNAKVKQIKIVPFFAFDYSNMIINGTTTHTEKRVISDNCHTAQIAATWQNGTSSWRYLLNDTITYMAHSCDAGFTAVNSTITTHWETKNTEPNPIPWVHSGKRMTTLGEFCSDKYPCPDYYWTAPEWCNAVLSWYNHNKITHEAFDRFLIWVNENDITNEYPYHEPAR